MEGTVDAKFEEDDSTEALKLDVTIDGLFASVEAEPGRPKKTETAIKVCVSHTIYVGGLLTGCITIKNLISVRNPVPVGTVRTSAVNGCGAISFTWTT